MKIPWYLMAKGKGGGTKTASGPIAHWTDGVDAPLKSLLVNIDPVQDLHGYDNPWPAGGGVNKVDVPSDIDTVNNGVKFKSKGGGIEISQTATAVYPQTPVLPYSNMFAVGETVTMSQEVIGTVPTGGRVYFLLVEYDGSTTTNHSLRDVSFETFTISKPQQRLAIVAEGNGITFPNIVARFQAELGSMPHSWTPYSNECPISGWSAVNVWVKPTYDPTANPTATIQLGQTVYGATLDVLTGKLTVDRVIDTFTKDSMWYGFSTGAGNSSAVVQLTEYQNCKYVDGSSSRNGAISSTGKEGQNYWIGSRQNEVPNDGDMCFAYSISGQLRFHRTDVTNITDLESFKAAFPDTQIVYYLANPIEYTLTPTQILSLVGENNLWATTGNVDVEYESSGGSDPNLMKLAVAFMGRE